MVRQLKDFAFAKSFFYVILYLGLIKRPLSGRYIIEKNDTKIITELLIHVLYKLHKQSSSVLSVLNFTQKIIRHNDTTEENKIETIQSMKQIIKEWAENFMSFVERGETDE